MIISAGIRAALGEMTQTRVATDDGVELLVQLFGSGPTVVFANGIGVRYPSAVRQILALRRHYRVVCWDYRGVGQSVMPLDRDLSMSRHAADILTILDHLEIDRTLFVGWSMGWQVSLEVVRADPGRVAGLVALFGTCGRPFSDAFPPPAANATHELFGFLHRHPDVMQGVLDVAVALPRLAFSVLQGVTFVGGVADRDVFAAVVSSVAGVDKRIYSRMLLTLAQYDAWDVLARVGCPTLVIAAEHDWLTPPKVARRMVEVLPDAVYREVPGGTHFALFERPNAINGWLLDFADRVLA